MSAESWIVRKVIKWLWARYPGQVKDIVLGPKAHVHRNPRKKECGMPGKPFVDHPLPPVEFPAIDGLLEGK